jgi:TPR repeat protein
MEEYNTIQEVNSVAKSLPFETSNRSDHGGKLAEVAKTPGSGVTSILTQPAHKAAFDCYLNAALLGDKQSLYQVGRCYYHEIGVSKNMSIANIWPKHAEINGIT